MSFTSVQLTGGRFQDAFGNRLAYGTLNLQLTVDALGASGTGQITAGTAINVPLDEDGVVAGTVSVQPNDLMSPSGSKYIVSLFDRTGRPAWATEHFWTIPSTSSSIDVGTIVPS